MKSPWNRYLAEFIATFLLIFIGAGSIVVSVQQGGTTGLVGIALAHGLAIFIGVAVTGHISGAHINPAVTFAMFVTKRIPLGQAFGYWVSQCAGAVVGAWLLTTLFSDTTVMQSQLGTPALATGVSVMNGIVIEAILTFFLVIAIFASAVDPKGPRTLAPLVIGLVITMDIFFGGPLTGAAMNPARAFGPALLSGLWTNHMVYWVGPLLGGAIGGWFYDRLLLSRA
ncbi:MAG: MIP family channel protein [Deltaproteobacteria bacterium]|nr:MIP family channel protein [Deltaproteobacteria bacterium]